MALLAVLLGATGCAQPGTYQTSLPATTVGPIDSRGAASGSGAGSPPASARAAILAGYRAYWDALLTAGVTADANSPLLPVHATGVALAQARNHFAELRRLGQVDRGTVELHPRVIAVRDEAATVRDCPDISHWHRRDAKSGALHDPPSLGRRVNLAVLYLVGGTWKVAVITGKEPCES